MVETMDNFVSISLLITNQGIKQLHLCGILKLNFEVDFASLLNEYSPSDLGTLKK